MDRDNGSLDRLELGAWLGFVRSCASLRGEFDAQLESAHNLQLSSYEVLRELAEAPGRRMRMRELAESVGLSRSGLSRLVDRLAQEQLIKREACNSDARGQYAVLTERGVKRLDQARPWHEAAIRARFLKHFSNGELAELSGYWDRLLTSR